MKIYLLLITLLLIPIIYSLAGTDECGRFMLDSDIPCFFPSTYKPSTGCIGNISIYNENGTFIQHIQWNESNPFCQALFNISTPIGTYILNSTIEDGQITLQREDNMLSIILTQLFIVSFFIAIGIPHKMGFIKFSTWSLALLEFIMLVWLIYINESGGSISAILEWNAIIMLILGGAFGILTIIVTIARLSKPDDEPMKDDSYTKYIFPK